MDKGQHQRDRDPFAADPYAVNPFGVQQPQVPGMPVQPGMAPVVHPGLTPEMAPGMAPAMNPAMQPPATYVGYPTVPANPRITPRTIAAAQAQGYDPEAVNAPLPKRAAALFADSVVYCILMALVLMGVNILGGYQAFDTAMLTMLLAGPLGFYGYRAAGDAIFEGSPGKHMLGLSMTGRNYIPVSGSDGLKRNVWILPSMIPFVGWLVSFGMLVWMAFSAGADPLGQGGHERAIGTRVTEKKDKKDRR